MNFKKNIPTVLCIIGAIVLGLAGVEKWWVFIVAAFLIATVEDDPLENIDQEIIDVLSQASEAIHAFEDGEGNMPSDTGEFRDLKAAVGKIDRTIDKMMEVA